MTRIWHILTGEYPPKPGGIADYTARLVEALTGRGEEVQVWTPGSTLPGAFDLAGLRSIGRGLAASRAAGFEPIVLVQYAPNAFGMRGANLLLCAWLLFRARRHRNDVRVMFHEPFFYFARQSLRRNALAAVHRVMAGLLLASSRVAYVSTGSWEALLSRYAAGRRTFVWLPIPATVLPPHDPDAAGRARARAARSGEAFVLGHFSSFPADVSAELERVLEAMLSASDDATVLLIGRNSDRFRDRFCERFPKHATRIVATGELMPGEVAHHLRACDVLVQPYPDGATSRRTSLMAPLACGVPTVTTLGRWSEPLWRFAGEEVELAPAGDAAAIVARCQKLANDPARRAALGAAARAFYARTFSMDRTLRILTGAGPHEPRVLLGVHAYPARGERDQRQRDALAAVAGLTGVRRVNLQFAAANAPLVEVDGFETVRTLENDSIRASGRAGILKPIVSEAFDLMARRALEEGCASFVYVTADTALSQSAVDCIAAGGADAFLFARTEVGGGRSSDIAVARVDGFAVDTLWWIANRRRFRSYILGEAAWRQVYAAQIACHGRARFVYDVGALTHERHEPDADADTSPFGSYVRYLSALDAPYLSRWRRYQDRLEEDVRADRGLGRAATIAREVFLWQPSPFGRAVHASRRVTGFVRYLAGQALP